MRDSFPGSDAGADSRQPQDDLSVYRVTDYTSADFLAALELCNQMIPVEQRQGTPEETIQQFRNAQDRRAQGLCPFEDYHFVAKLASGVCGYMQLFFTRRRSSRSSVSLSSALVFRSESKWHG